MSDFLIRPLTTDDPEWVSQFISRRWGTKRVIAHGTIYYPHKLPGFVALEDNQAIGLLTYQLDQSSCEIVTLDSTRPDQGIGTALINAVLEAARRSGCERVWLITTNDNLNALRFYQKRGFELVAVHRHAVDEARRIKPEIPLVGANGIPVRDEIELELPLNE
jgi:GNAT superfamily N-acetyltransferase